MSPVMVLNCSLSRISGTPKVVQPCTGGGGTQFVATLWSPRTCSYHLVCCLSKTWSSSAMKIVVWCILLVGAWATKLHQSRHYSCSLLPIYQQRSISAARLVDSKIALQVARMASIPRISPIARGTIPSIVHNLIIHIFAILVQKVNVCICRLRRARGRDDGNFGMENAKGILDLLFRTGT